MSYFKFFPKLLYSLNKGQQDQKFVPNIFAKTKFVKNALQNSSLIFKYPVKDGETPEQIAFKMYDDESKHWMVLLANDVMDPQYDWVLSQRQFNEYINNKYSSYNLLLDTEEWTPVLINMEQSSPATFTKTGGIDGNYDSSVRSAQGYTNCFASTKVSTITNNEIEFGLTSDPEFDNNWDSIDYSFYFSNDYYEIYENGDYCVGYDGYFTTDDVFSITYDGVDVKYYKNDILIRSVARTASSELYLDTSFSIIESSLNSLQFAPFGYTSGDIVYQGSSIDASSAEAKVVSYDYVNRILCVNNLTEVLANNEIITSVASGVSTNIIGITRNDNGYEWASNTISHYQVTEKRYNSYDQIFTTDKYIISSKDYNHTNHQVFNKNTLTSYSNTYTMADSTELTITTEIAPVTYYDYEVELNEAKREINIIKSDYVGFIDSQFKTLMGK